MSRIAGLRRFFRLPSAERDVDRVVDDEIAFHLHMLADELEAQGLSRDEAQRRAEQRFGSVDRIRERCHDISLRHHDAMRRSTLLSDARQDFGYALRSLRAAPAFTAVVLLTLALGIGATTAIFSVVHAVLLRPLPYPAAEQLVRLWPANPGAEIERGAVSVIEVDDWSNSLSGFSAVAGYSTIGAGMVLGEGEPVYVRSAYVTPHFFRTLGTPALLGRHILPEEHEDGRNDVVVLSHAMWQSELGGDPGAIGRTIRLDGNTFTVVGVMPPSFDFPTPDVRLWTPTSIFPESAIPRLRQVRWLGVVGRMQPATSVQAARAELLTLSRRLAADHPESNAGWTGASVLSLRDSLVGNVRTGLLVLMGVVALVLLIACVNVANLILVRAAGRDRELSVRAALGAGRARLARLLLTESLMLALLGGALGVLLAWVGVRALVAMSGEFLPRAASVRMDPTVLVFTVVVSIATGLAFGLLPALRASRARLADALKDSARGSTGGAGANRARALLVGAEVALAVVLVASAGLMLRSFEALTSSDPGFRAEQALLARFSISRPDDGPVANLVEQRRRVVERVREVPGVIAAGATTYAPFTAGSGEPVTFTVPGREPPAPGDEPMVTLLPASPGYLDALGVRLLAGEDIDVASGDTVSTPMAVISQRMAERFWPGQTAVGESFIMRETPVRVIGVAADVRATRRDSLEGYTAYVPERMMPRVSMSIIARTSGDPAALSGPVRDAIREVFPNQAILELVPLEAKLSEAVRTPRFFTTLVTIFGAVALLLAVVGLYGVVGYVVAQRQREIGVRMALGARPDSVVALMLRRGMVPVVGGLVVGIGAALAATRLLRGLLYGIGPTDPATFIAVTLLLLGVAFVAAWIPSRRAAAVAPAVTLRAE